MMGFHEWRWFLLIKLSYIVCLQLLKKGLCMFNSKNKALSIVVLLSMLYGCTILSAAQPLYREKKDVPEYAGPGADLFRALRSENTADVERIIKGGVNLNQITDDLDRTPLILAVKMDLLPEVKLLIGAGANVNKKNWEGSMAVQYAASSRVDPRILEFLIAAGADINAQGGYGHRAPLHIASYGDNLKTVEVLIGAGADVDVQDERGNTPFAYCIKTAK